MMATALRTLEKRKAYDDAIRVCEMLEAAAADATPWVERRDELARKAANAHAVDARAAVAPKDEPQRDVDLVGIMARAQLVVCPGAGGDRPPLRRSETGEARVPRQAARGTGPAERRVPRAAHRRPCRRLREGEGARRPHGRQAGRRRRFGAEGARRTWLRCSPEQPSEIEAARDVLAKRAQGLRRSCLRDCEGLEERQRPVRDQPAGRADAPRRAARARDPRLLCSALSIRTR